MQHHRICRQCHEVGATHQSCDATVRYDHPFGLTGRTGREHDVCGIGRGNHHARTVAFEQPPGGGLIKPALRNLKRMGVVTTCGAPWVYDRLLMQDPARKVLLRGLKATCGGLGVKHLYLAQHSVYDISPAARERFAQKVEQRFARF